MKLVSWNVNGIRAAMGKGFRDFVEQDQPDVLCLQETKAEPQQVDLEWAEKLGYDMVWNCAEKKGYSGTSIWTRVPFKKAATGLGIVEHDNEGRIITMTFDDFTLVNVYTPNSQRGLKRLSYRQQWDADFLTHVKNLNRKKPVIFCGDLNCAHQEIDLKNPASNKKNAGFTPEERVALDRMIDCGFVDSFRNFNTDPDHYSWWTYRSDARARNVGWRLDYFWVTKKLVNQLKSAKIRPDIFGSDHCPVQIELAN